MEKATNFRIVFVTNDSYHNSYQMARIVVNERLAACCTIIPNCLSLFNWNGAIEERSEFLMLIKTSDENLELLESRIKELHTDSVPEIVAIDMSSAHHPYLSWLTRTLKQ